MISILAIFILIFTLTDKDGVYAKPIILKLANYHSEKHPLAGEDGFFGYFRKRVEELTKGRVQIKVYYGQSLLKAREQIDGVRDGIADISWTGYALDNRAVMLGASELPFYYPSVKALFEAINATQSIWEKDFNHLGLKVLFAFPGGYYQLQSKKPIRTLEDMKGLRIRAPGGLMTKGIVYLGASPITTTVTDMYTAFQRGMLDASFGLPSSALALHIYEACDYLAKIDSWNVGIAIFMKKDIFDGFSKKIQKQLMDAAQDTERFALLTSVKVDSKAIEALSRKGMKLYEVPPAERARWKSATKPIVQMWLRKTGEPGKKMLEKIDKIIEKYER